MMLNNDDTQMEQYMNSMHRETDVMLNCSKCGRLYFTDRKIAISKNDKNIPLLCNRCQKEVK